MFNNFRTLFDRVVVITRRDRQDRWEEFKRILPSSWPFRPPLRFPAVHGEKVPKPAWWNQPAAAWGCLLSHRQVIQDALQSGLDSILIFEDDAAFAEDFVERTKRYVAALPTDWRWIYLGGEHLEHRVSVPTRINDFVYRPYNVNRTHAYGIRTREMMERILAHIDTSEPWKCKHHVDHRYGELQKETSSQGCYTPDRWLVGQREGWSDITRSHLSTRYYDDSVDLVSPRIDCQLVAVLGPFSGGTSATAGVLQKLGIPMQEKGRSSKDKRGMETYEHSGLWRVCRQAFEEPSLQQTMDRDVRLRLLRIWGGRYCREYRSETRLLGAKVPHLCLMGEDLLTVWPGTKFIVVDRPEADTVNSLVKRGWGWGVEGCVHAVHQLVLARETFLMTSAPDYIRIDYRDLVQAPREVIDSMRSYLSLRCSVSQFEAAVASIEGYLV